MTFEEWSALTPVERKRIQEQPGYKIFHKLWRVKLPVHEIVSEEEIARRGTFSTGVDAIDNSRGNMSEWVYRTIAQLLPIWERRSPIIFNNHEETTRAIHEIIQGHIDAMMEHISTENRGMRKANDDTSDRIRKDIARLDDFGEGIYNHARKYQPERTRMNILFDPSGEDLGLGDKRVSEARTRKYERASERFKDANLKGTRRWR